MSISSWLQLVLYLAVLLVLVKPLGAFMERRPGAFRIS